MEVICCLCSKGRISEQQWTELMKRAFATTFDICTVQIDTAIFIGGVYIYNDYFLQRPGRLFICMHNDT